MSGNNEDVSMVLRVLDRVMEVAVATRREVVETRLRLTRMEEAMSRKAGKDDVATLRQGIAGYHASVMGHGLLISELDDRVRCIERRLDIGAAQ